MVPNVNVPEDKISASSVIRLRKKGESRDRDVHHPSPKRKPSGTDDTRRKSIGTDCKQSGTSGATDKPLCFVFKQGKW